MAFAVLVPFVVPIVCSQTAFGQSIEIALWGRQWIAHVPQVVWRDGGLRGEVVPSFPSRSDWTTPGSAGRWDPYRRFESDLAYANAHNPGERTFPVGVLHAIELELVGEVGRHDSQVLDEREVRRPDRPERFVESDGDVWMSVYDDSPPGARTRLAARVVLNVDEWREAVRTWVGVISFQWTGLERRGRSAVDASGVAVIDRQFTNAPVSLTRSGFVVDTDSPRGLDAEGLRLSLLAAAEGRTPPLPRLLLSEAFNELHRQNWRKAVADAGIALETALTSLLDQHLEHVDERIAAKLTDNVPLGRLVNMLAPALADRDLKDVVRLRNRVVHHGVEPTYEEAVRVVSVVADVVVEHCPL